MAYLLLVIGVVLLFTLSVMNFITGFNEAAFAYGFFGFLLCAFTAIYLYGIKRANEHLSRDKLLEWIKKHKSYVLSGEPSYKGQIVSKNTILIRYCIVYSAIIFTRKAYTNYYVAGSFKSGFIGISCTIFNLIFGWWALPWGPIYTSQSIFCNLMKKESISVYDLLNSPDNSILIESKIS